MVNGVKYMGIVNLTDDSFVTADRMGAMKVSAVAEKVGEMLSCGADIIDVGACSTAPGNVLIPASHEWGRLEKVLPALFAGFPGVCFSIDSFHVSVVKKAYELASKFLDRPEEQFVINDVSGASHQRLLEFAADMGLTYIAVCNNADPESFFHSFSVKAGAAGLDNWILDPGFGFGKSIGDNWKILRNLRSLTVFGKPVLCALSRKRMIYVPLNLTPDTCSVQSVEAEKLAISNGAAIIRTHDLMAHIRKS